MIKICSLIKKGFTRILILGLCWQVPGLYADQAIHRDNWYLSQDLSAATIQMSGHKSEQDAIDYIKASGLSGDVGYYQTIYKNNPWYAVTYGNYESLAEARQNLSSLPDALQANAPWPRTFKAIVKLIDASAPANTVLETRLDDNQSDPEKAAASATWEDGQAAYDAGNFTEAMAIWQLLAEQGDELSQFNLGVMYSRGEGEDKSGNQAVKWYSKAAEQGYAPAQFNLGAIYLEGKFTKEDASRAAAWWQMAAEQGFVQAQFNLASLYCRGIGVNRDQGQCKLWYGRAASNGDIHARKMLDILNREEASQKVQAESEPVAESASESAMVDDSVDDLDVEKKQASAEAELDASLVAAAEQSLKEEKRNNPKPAKKPAVRKISSKEHAALAKAQKAFTRGDYEKALKLWLPLAKQGIAEAQYSLGFLYQSGWGPQQDLVQAVAWYTNASEQNEARAQFNLGVLLLNGEGDVEKDTESGVLWLTRSADGNNARAKEFLIKAYQQGSHGIEKSQDKAKYWKSR